MLASAVLHSTYVVGVLLHQNRTVRPPSLEEERGGADSGSAPQRSTCCSIQVRMYWQRAGKRGGIAPNGADVMYWYSTYLGWPGLDVLPYTHTHACVRCGMYLPVKHSWLSLLPFFPSSLFPSQLDGMDGMDTPTLPSSRRPSKYHVQYSTVQYSTW